MILLALCRRLKRWGQTWHGTLVMTTGLFVLAALVGAAFAERLKEDTAAQLVVVGPFVTSSTGYTVGTSLTITPAEILVSKNGAAPSTKHDAANATHLGLGYYSVQLDATDTSTAGNLEVLVYESGYLRCKKTCIVQCANVFDSLFAAATTDYLQVDTLQLGGATQSATDLKDFADTGYDPTNHIAQSDLIYIHGTALTETAGQLAGRFVNFFDQASAGYSVATTLASFKATGYSTHTAANVVTALGTGTTLTAIPWNSAWDAEVESEVDDSLGGGTGTALTGIPWNAAWDAEAQSEAADALTAWGKTGFSLAADQSAVTVGTVTTLTNWHASVTDWTDGGRLDAILDTISGNSTSILADTGTDGVVVASGSKTGFSLAAAGLDLVIVKIDGVNTTLPNAVKLGVRQLVGDMAIVGTTMTYSDADGNIVVYTLNHATTPTARTRN